MADTTWQRTQHLEAVIFWATTPEDWPPYVEANPSGKSDPSHASIWAAGPMGSKVHVCYLYDGDAILLGEPHDGYAPPGKLVAIGKIERRLFRDQGWEPA